MVPESVCIPALIVKAPTPLMSPLKPVLPSEIVNVLPPRVTVPEPLRVAIVVPELVAEISKVPLAATPEEAATDPDVRSAKVAPLLIVVAPA